MTNFGALVNGSMTTAAKIGILNDLGVEYTRNAINISTWTGVEHGAYDQYIAAGKKVLLNLNWAQSSGGPVPFPTDMTAYALLVNDILDTIADPEVIVVENEEINPDYHDDPEGNIADYVTMLATMAGIAHARGLTVANGGVYGTGLDMLVYRYLDATYGAPTASHYADGSMSTVQRNAAITPGSNPTLEAKATMVRAVLDGIVSGNVDYANIHPYEISDPDITNDADILTITPDIVRYQKEYVEFYTGKPCITNETGQRDNTQPELVESILTNFFALGFEYMIWFNGIGSAGAQPLNLQIAPYSLEPNGIAFRDTVANLMAGGNVAPIVIIETPDSQLLLPNNSIAVTAQVIDVDGTVTLLWTRVSGGTYVIDDPTADDILITDLEEGEYVFRLTATDDDGATSYDEITISVNVNNEAGLPTKLFKFYLCNSQGRSYTVDTNGNVIITSIDPLKSDPEEWQEIEVVMPRNEKYHGIERLYTSSYKFPKDGAKIIRYLLYASNQSGVFSPLHLLVYKLNLNTFNYDPYFTGEVDLMQAEDDLETGVTISIIQGGAAACIKTFENVTYDIDCDEVLVNFDPGRELQDVYNYSTYEAEIDSVPYLVPLVFTSNEGDSVGTLSGGEYPEKLLPRTNPELTEYFKNGGNFPFQTITGITGIRLYGNIPFTPSSISGLIAAPTVRFYLYKSLDASPFTDRVLLGQVSDPDVGTAYNFTFDYTFNLLPNEKFYIGVEPLAIETSSFHIIDINEGGIIKAEFVTQVPASTAWALHPLTLLQRIVDKMNDKGYRVESTLLTEKDYLVAIAGDALRQFENPKIKTSLTDFFESYGKVLHAGIGVRQSDQTIIFERKEWFFDNATLIANIGEVSEFKLSIAQDYMYSSVVVGSPDQNYNQRNGRNETNSEQTYSIPRSKAQKELDLRTKYRTDHYGIEFIRAELIEKTTTDNTGDNNVFIVNTEEQAVPGLNQYSGDTNDSQTVLTAADVEFDNVTGLQFTANVAKTEFTYVGTAQNIQIGINIEFSGIDQSIYASIEKNNSSVFTQPIAISGGTGGSTFGINNLPIAPGDVIKFRAESVSASFDITTASFTITLGTTVQLVPRRPAYTSITGMPLPDTSYNLEELTPKSILLANGADFGSLYSIPNELIKFESGKKNTALVKVLDGVTVNESANILISDLSASYYRPFIAEFTTKVPINILSLMQNAGKGHISFTWNGYQLYGFPLKLSVRPAFQDAQVWTVLISSLTNIDGLRSLNINQIIIEDMGIISHRIGLKFVPIDVTMPLQYHLAHMDNDWHKNRITRYSVKKQYFQKQQLNDTMPLQFISKSSLRVRILDCRGALITELTPSQVSNQAIVFPSMLLETTINWSLYGKGTYYVNLIFGAGSGAKQYISEPISVATDYRNTLLIEAGNSQNYPDIILNGGFKINLRIEGIIQKFTPDARASAYEDEPMGVDALYAVPFRKWELFIGGDFGMPDWLIDKAQRLLVLDNLKIDGYYYAISPGQKLEPTEIAGSPYRYWRIELREKNNRGGIPITGIGVDGGELTVEYGIDTSAFTAIGSPTVNQQTNLVQVTEVEGTP